MLESMFHLDLPIIEKIIRPILVYFFLVILLRVFGKRELAQLNPFDLVVLLALSNTVQNAIIGNDNSVTGGMIGAIALVAINYVMIKIIHYYPTIDSIVEGKSTELIKSGQVLHEVLIQEEITEKDLLTAIRRQGFESFEDVEVCTLDPNGTFEILGKKPTSNEKQHLELLTEINNLKDQIQNISRALIKPL